MLSSQNTGRYNGAEWVDLPDTHWQAGNAGRKAVVLHVTEGSAASAISHFKSVRVSSHFLIARTGHIYQFVSVYDTAYANGLSWSPSRKCWVDPEGVLLLEKRPPWSGLTPPTNPNLTTISIEEEGLHTEPRTQAQAAARLVLLRWIAAQFATALKPYIPGVNLIGHRDISPVNRANCPGPHIDFAAIASAVNDLSILGYYRLKPAPIFQRQQGDGPIAGYLESAEEHVGVDRIYPNGMAHLSDGRGFVRLSLLEPV